MKAFDEWFNKEYEHTFGIAYLGDYEVAKDIWRAALEWVRLQSGCCMDCLMADIDEELDDSNTRPNGTTNIF